MIKQNSDLLKLSLMTNPFLEKWNTPYETPPFHLIETGHYRQAVDEALKTAYSELDAITGNNESPTFENTVAALENCGENLGKISAVLFNLNSAETSKELQSTAQEISQLLTRFSNDITLNDNLFRRIKSIYNSKDTHGYATDQLMLIEKQYRNFVLGGAGLDNGVRKRFREISEELSELTLKFEENVLNETNAFELHITDEGDLQGLPADIRESASAEAENRKKEGWIFTLKYPSYVPFMQYCVKRELREKMYRAYNSRAFHNNENDNRSLVTRIVNLRLEIAKMLGFSNYAGMTLGDRMAENPEKVNTFLETLLEACHSSAVRDFNNVVDFASKSGHNVSFKPWDWSFFSEKLKKAKYDFDDETLRPYFQLENVQEAIFGLASRLYGLKFIRNYLVPVYNDEVSVWEVYDTDDTILSLLYLDYYPRPGKSGGAWMTSYREQKKQDGKRIIPLISIVTNFSRPSGSKPSLLTFNELTTFLHEFGHSLHGMLSQCTYESLSGTNVARDFVELPSQFMENWAFEHEWLDSWAVHYQTGEKIPSAIIEKIKKASTFNEGYACDRQLGFGFIDMAWHTISEPFGNEVNDFEKAATARTRLFPEVEDTNMSCSFTHIFGGGYAAGYYGYKWAEVIDADAFRFFKDSGVFNSEIAESFRRNILEKGGTAKPMYLYKQFRGKEPDIDAFLERSGLKETVEPRNN